MIRHTLLALGLFAGATQLSALTDQQKTYLETYGWIVGQQSGIAQLGLNEEEFKVLLKGLEIARKADEPPHNIQLVGPDMNSFLKGKADAYRETYEAKMEATQKRTESDAAQAAQVNKDKAEEFIAKLQASNDNLKRTDSGLYYEIIESGNAVKPGSTDEVTVHYEGTLINGEMFDSSVKRGKPATFGLNQVIPGWTEGLQLIGKGGKLKLYVPSDLGYGDEGRPGIPPGAMLIFDVELIDVKQVDKKVSAVTPALGVEDAKKAQ